jgi:hypothetical protein
LLLEVMSLLTTVTGGTSYSQVRAPLPRHVRLQRSHSLLPRHEQAQWFNKLYMYITAPNPLHFLSLLQILLSDMVHGCVDGVLPFLIRPLNK